MSPDADRNDGVPEVELLRSGGNRLMVYVVAPVGVVLLALVVLLATRDPHQNEIDARIVDQLAPATVGETIDGEPFDIDDLRGRWVLVNFFATSCVPCIEEHPSLVEFAERHERDATVVSIAFGDTPRNVADFFDANGGDWPVLASNVEAAGVGWGVVAVPESYLVRPDGIVARKIVGGVDVDDLERALDEASGGASP